MRIDSTVTSGKFRLDGGEWDVDNNVYVVGDDSSVYVVDPSHDLDAVAELVGDRRVEGILLTHAHNDHCELAPEAAKRFDTEVYLHPDDDMLWQESNGDAPYTPLADRGQFDIGGEKITVYHTPGHSPGCVVLHVGEVEAPVFAGQVMAVHRQCGDRRERQVVVARQGIGDGRVVAGFDDHLVKAHVQVVVGLQVVFGHEALVE